MKPLAKRLVLAALLVTGAATAPSLGEPTATVATYDFSVTSDWLTMPDGVQLSVTYWMPVAKTPDQKFPVVLEALPYRKDDDFYLRDYPIFAYFARRGIVGARLDIRGTGSSYGVAPAREYSDAELDDLVDVVGQLARQPWSNGNVGMQGISWSAFNAIMTAMRRPPALKGIFVVHGSEDLYANDIHDIDGGLHIDPSSITIDIQYLMPRSPAYRLDDAYFHDRFNVEPALFAYLRHQRDGPFWQTGRSLQADYASVDVPVYAVGGLLDGYRDFVLAMLDHLNVPVKAEIGPWNHDHPNTGVPGPNYEWRDNAVRWWRQLLEHQDTGIMAEPKLLAFMRGSVAPGVNLAMTPGSFRLEDWPVRDVRWTRLMPQADGTLTTTPGTAAQMPLHYRPSAGAGSLNWWGETTPDMRLADRDALVYDSTPLGDEMQIIGQPTVTLRVGADAPLAHWVVRLEDVNPDGSVSFITGALRNGAQRLSRTDPQPIVPGQMFALTFPLHFTTWTFARGHRIRLVVSNSQFPMIWPTPYAMTTVLAVGDGATALDLPAAPPGGFPAPSLLPSQPSEYRTDGKALGGESLTPFTLETDAQGNVIAVSHESSNYEIDGMQFLGEYRAEYRVNDRDPADAAYLGEGKNTLKSNDRTIVITQTSQVHSDLHFFHTSVTRSVTENGRELGFREWHEDIARDFQ